MKEFKDKIEEAKGRSCSWAEVSKISETVYIIFAFSRCYSSIHFEPIEMACYRNGFTSEETDKIAKFMYNPTKESAFKALRETPKMSLFLEVYLGKDRLVEELVKIINDENTSFAYMEELLKIKKVREITEEVFMRATNAKAKKCYMEMSLS